MSESRLIRTANSGFSCLSAICWLASSTSRNRRFSRSRARRSRCPANSISVDHPRAACGGRSKEGSRGAPKGNYILNAVRNQQNRRSFVPNSEQDYRFVREKYKTTVNRFRQAFFGRPQPSLIIVPLAPEIKRHLHDLLRPRILV